MPGFASLRLGAALFAVSLTFLVFVQLFAISQHSEQVPVSSFTRNFNQWKSRASAASAASTDNLFLVGAGKADVTGYSSFRSSGVISRPNAGDSSFGALEVEPQSHELQLCFSFCCSCFIFASATFLRKASLLAIFDRATER